jgi:hypothetical protein
VHGVLPLAVQSLTFEPHPYQGLCGVVAVQETNKPPVEQPLPAGSSLCPTIVSSAPYTSLKVNDFGAPQLVPSPE